MVQYWDAISLQTCKLLKINSSLSPWEEPLTPIELDTALKLNTCRSVCKNEIYLSCLLLISLNSYVSQWSKEVYHPVGQPNNTVLALYCFNACTHRHMQFTDLQQNFTSHKAHKQNYNIAELPADLYIYHQKTLIVPLLIVTKQKHGWVGVQHVMVLMCVMQNNTFISAPK